jgi:hypothetical protein
MTETLVAHPRLDHPLGSGATIAAVLTWLGHDCTPGCPATLDTIGARVWFVRRPSDTHSRRHTLVVLDLSEVRQAPAVVRRLLRDASACVRVSGIDLGRRRAGDNGRALSVVTGEPHTSTRFLFPAGDRQAVGQDIPRGTPVPASPWEKQ